MFDFDNISSWGTEWIIIGGVAALIVLILLFVILGNKKKNVSKPVAQEAKATQPVKPQSEPVVKEEPISETKSESKKIKEESVSLDDEIDNNEEDKADEQPLKDEPKKEKSKSQAQKYHVSQNKDEDSEHFGKWRVRKSGSKKTIKYFNTQKEAIEFAQELAKNQDASIVIHKRDGTIRKQDYSKK